MEQKIEQTAEVQKLEQLSAQALSCSCCKKPIVGGEACARFACPGCAEQEFVRCLRCRKAATRYTCPKCGFEGPN